MWMSMVMIIWFMQRGVCSDLAGVGGVVVDRHGHGWGL